MIPVCLWITGMLNNVKVTFPLLRLENGDTEYNKQTLARSWENSIHMHTYCFFFFCSPVSINTFLYSPAVFFRTMSKPVLRSLLLFFFLLVFTIWLLLSHMVFCTHSERRTRYLFVVIEKRIYKKKKFSRHFRKLHNRFVHDFKNIYCT